MKPAYLRKIDTGECFAYSEYLLARGDFTSWTGPLPWEPKAPVKPAIVIPSPEVKETVGAAQEPPAQEPEKPAEPSKEETQGFACPHCDFVAKSALGLKSHSRKHA